MQVNAQKAIPYTESVDTETAALLMGCSWPQVKKLILAGRLPAYQTYGGKGGNRGFAYQVPIATLPPEAQMRWRAMKSQAAVDADIASYKAKKAQAAVDKLGIERRARAEEKRIREETGSQALAALQARVDAVEALKELQAKHGGKVAARQEIASRLGIGVRQLYELEKAYDAEGWAGLMDRTERADKGKPRAMCLMAQDYVQAEYCTSGKVRQNVIFDNLAKVSENLGCAACEICPHNPGSLCRAELVSKGKDPGPECQEAGNGIVIPGSRHTLNRYISSIPEAVKMAGQRGWAYWEARFMPKVRRDKPEKINECWFGDHHVFDIFVLLDGKPVRPWLTAWMDAKSNGIVGWCISPNPNSDTITEALATAIAVTVGSPFSGPPEMIYIDNGKDYRCHRIEGDGTRLTAQEIGQVNLDFTGENALLRTLGIGYVHAIPYRAWSKPIERIFGIIEPRWIRGLPGYCENGIDDKPDSLNKDIRDGKLLTWDEFVALWATKIWPEYNAFRAEGADASPLEIYQAGEKARTDQPAWSLLAIAKSLECTRKVTPMGISLDKKTYWDAAMARYVGQEVRVVYTRTYTGSVTVMSLEGQFIAEAADRALNPYKMVGESPERIADHMREQQAARRAVREALRMPVERVRMLGAMACEIPELGGMNSNITSLVHDRAFRGQQEGRERIQEAQGAKKAAEKASGSRMRDKWAAAGQEAIKGR